ncbi:MAG: pyridoxamine 5'-phosphate oxidase family protein [Acidimicrobiales bacterium]
MSHAMTTTEREEFLAGVHVGVLGIDTETGCLAVPIWYDYEPGGDITIVTGAESVKGRALGATRRFSLCAQDEAPPYKYVTVEGEVTSVEPCPVDVNRAMAHRYLGPEFGDLYIDANADHADANRLYRLTPQRWYTVDYAKDFA